MARQLEDAGDRVTTVTLIDPPTTSTDRADDRASLVDQLHQLMPWIPMTAAASSVEATADLPEPERIRALVQQLTDANLGADELSLIERQVGVLLANRRALAAWHPADQVDALTVVVPQNTNANELVDIGRWRQHSRTQVRLEVVPGDHFSMLSGEGLAVLRDVLDDRGQ